MIKEPTIYIPHDPLDLLEEALEAMKYFASDASDLSRGYMIESKDNVTYDLMSLAAKTILSLNPERDVEPFQSIYYKEEDEWRATILNNNNHAYMPHCFFIDGIIDGKTKDVLEYILYTSRIHESKLPSMVIIHNPRMEEQHEELLNSVLSPIQSFKNCLRQAIVGIAPSSLTGMNRYAERFERVRKCISDYTSYMPCSD